MFSMQPLFLALVFAVVVAVTYIVLRQLMPTAVQRRAESLAGQAQPGTHPLLERIAHWLMPLAKPSLPEAGWEHTPLRVRFANAGLRSSTAPIVYFGMKTLLTFALPGLLLIYLGLSAATLRTSAALPALLLLAACGYYLPNVVLAQLVKHRQRELFEAFPDALDLMRVCVEAGLGLDAAIERVGREMALESSALAEEFHLVTLELRAGASRADALRNLAVRVGLEDIDAMVSMLVQADRFGTSIAESLRVHSDALRTKRRLLAEEKAAKLPVTLLFPLIFCIFPALLTVLLGPAVITVVRVLIPTITR